MFQKSFLQLGVLLLFLTILFSSSVISVYAQVSRVTGYYVPCLNGTRGTVTTRHSYSGNVNNPTDPNRRSYDFQCRGSNIVFSPAAGRIASITNNGNDNFSNYLQIEDTSNSVCISVIHLGTFSVSQGQQVVAGTRLGVWASSAGHVHISARPAPCTSPINYTNEIPIIWNEAMHLGNINGPNVSQPLTTTNGNYSDGNPSGVWYTSQNPSGTVVARITNLSWDFSSGYLGWNPSNDLTDVKLLDGGIYGQLTGGDPRYVGPVTAPFNAEDFDRLRFTISNQSGQCIELYWKGPGQDFARERGIPFDLPNPNGTFTIQLDEIDAWTGVVNRLRFDPACRREDGKPNAVRVDLIELLRPDGSSLVPLINWNFGLAVTQAWVAENDLAGVSQLDGGMWAYVTGGDPWYVSPVMQPFPAAEFDELYFTMSTRENQCIQLFWRGVGQGFTENRSKQFNIQRNGEYSMSLTSADNWSGMIEQIRFDPICRKEPDGDPTTNGIRINTIQLRQAASAPPQLFEIVLDPAMATIGLGEQTTISALMVNPDLALTGGIRALDIACNVDNPNLLAGVQLAVEDAFPPEAINIPLPAPDFNPAPDLR